jgi:hypothetical protein
MGLFGGIFWRHQLLRMSFMGRALDTLESGYQLCSLRERVSEEKG